MCESGEVELGNYSFVVAVILCGKQYNVYMLLYSSPLQL